VGGVIVAFAVLTALIGAGYLSARVGFVELETGRKLNVIAFYVFSPALLFSMLSQASSDILFSPVLLIIFIASASTALLFILISRLFFRRTFAETTIGFSASSYLNANNFGLPVSLFVLGDLAYFAPVLLLHLVVFLPVILILLEFAKYRGASILKAFRSTVTNPLILASVLGSIISATDLVVPEVILTPLETMGAAAVPMILFAYGVSLRGQKLFEQSGDRPFTATVVVLKSLVMPTIAYLLSAFVFQLSAEATFAAVILASLPAAQNVFTFASVYQTKMFEVRDVLLITTVMSLPIMFVVALLLRP
jgi:malonate transporter